MKILLCNEAHLGDLILSTAVLPALKKAMPDCKIGFLAGSWAKEVVEKHRYIDWVHTYDQVAFNRKNIARKTKREIEKKSKKKALEEVLAIEYDIALDLHSYYAENSAHFLSKTEIRQRVAFATCQKPFFYNTILFWDLSLYQMIENHRQMLLELGIAPAYLENFRPCLDYCSPLEPVPKDLPEKYFVVHLGTGEPLREWNLSSWKILANKLDRLNYPLLFIGRGKKEVEAIAYVTSDLKNSYDCSNRFSWKELLPIVQKAQFLVGLESMAGHLAAHFGTPALLIYAADGFGWRPYHPYCHIVKPKARYLNNRERILPLQPIHTITPDEVYAKITKILGARKLL